MGQIAGGLVAGLHTFVVVFGIELGQLFANHLPAYRNLITSHGGRK